MLDNRKNKDIQFPMTEDREKKQIIYNPVDNIPPKFQVIIILKLSNIYLNVF